MNANQRSDIRFIISIVFFLVCLPIVYLIAFRRGEEYGVNRAQVSSANDSAFYCLSGLRAIENPEKFKLLLQISLDGEAIRLSEICLAQPEWIGRTNYNLLKSINRYLSEHQSDRNAVPSLRPIVQVTSKVHQATVRLESLHDVRKWKDEQP